MEHLTVVGVPDHKHGLNEHPFKRSFLSILLFLCCGILFWVSSFNLKNFNCICIHFNVFCVLKRYAFLGFIPMSCSLPPSISSHGVPSPSFFYWTSHLAVLFQLFLSQASCKPWSPGELLSLYIALRTPRPSCGAGRRDLPAQLCPSAHQPGPGLHLCVAF